MTPQPSTAESRFACRSAIEGLRAGVPNPLSVTALGCDQVRIIAEFERQIETATGGKAARGLLIRGDFGSGKSHALHYLRELALEKGFVCSRLYISKDTPLYDPVKLFQAAADSAAAPGRTGNAFIEMANQLIFNSPAYRDLERWANQQTTSLDGRFPASLLLFEKFESDHEFRESIIRFWAGDRLAVGEFRKRLRQLGTTYSPVVVSARDLAVQRFRFAARLMRAAGYAGWLLLVDEVELIGSYSALQRAKAYIEIARLMNATDDPVHGVLSVMAITEDFASAVLENKNDLDRIPKLLREKMYIPDAPDPDQALAGMNLLQTGGVSLRRPDDVALTEAYTRIRELYSGAYAWLPPGRQGTIRRDQTTPLRTYIRSWIAEWDLMRLFGQMTLSIETEAFHTEYVEAEASEEERPSDQSIVDELTDL